MNNSHTKWISSRGPTMAAEAILRLGTLGLWRARAIDGSLSS